MSLKQAEGMPIIQALAMTVAEIPVFLYSTFGQVNTLFIKNVAFIFCVKGTLYQACKPFSKRWMTIIKLLDNIIQYVIFFCLQSIFSQLKLSPSLKKVLFATALGSVALALTAHQLKRRGRKRKQVTKRRESQKTVGIPEALLRTGRPSSLKRGERIDG